ncbi:Endopolyphosphatase [Lambiella insularis]|nr:Endopolyphosphatase [Lambiella insularis]
MLGAETTDCDSPLSLVNATFEWIGTNLKDKIDFVVWTGDSARHDNDEQIPRTTEQVTSQNRMLVRKFVDVFGKKDHVNDTNPTNDFIVPIVPTWGNNDILPHNIFTKGPNIWTRTYLDIWKKLIPEEQRHGFERGGWFYVEVIPNRLVVLSLNTLYFFDSNAAVDGCSATSEPGYQHLEWLRIQLQFLRQRGLKAILMGHVPPARTESKMSWDETCWQKYTLWLHQYRDVVVGSVYGHMNIDHFILQDSKEVDLLNQVELGDNTVQRPLSDNLSVQSAADYLTELRSEWSHLPKPPKSKPYKGKANHESKRRRKEHKFYDKIGGQWAEHYSLSLVSPSVIPNYFPTLRVIEYNISGLDTNSNDGICLSKTAPQVGDVWEPQEIRSKDDFRNYWKLLTSWTHTIDKLSSQKPRKPEYKIPKGPSRSSPPGPAYSPQSLSWLSYIQYYANLTEINNDFTNDTVDETDENGIHETSWNGGKHREKSKPKPNKYDFEIEYDTRDDEVYGLKDLTVKSYVDLARRIGQYKPRKGDHISTYRASSQSRTEDDLTSDVKPFHKDHKKKKRKKKHGKHKKHEKRKAINRVWFAFVSRAFVGSRQDCEIHDEFGQPLEASDSRET